MSPVVSPALQVDSSPLSHWGSPSYTMLLLSCISRVRLCATPWTAAHQAHPSMGFSGQEYGSGVPLPSPSYTIRHPKIKDAQCDR